MIIIIIIIIMIIFIVVIDNIIIILMIKIIFFIWQILLGYGERFLDLCLEFGFQFDLVYLLLWLRA